MLDFSINLRSILLLLAMVQGLVIGVLLLRRGRKARLLQDYFLAGLLLSLATSLISYFIGFMGLYDYAREHGWDLSFFPFGNPYLTGPFIWLYVQAVTNRQFAWAPPHWRHFALPAVFYVVSLYCWSLPSGSITGATEQFFIVARDLLDYSSIGFYLYLSLRRIQVYRRLVAEEYSNADKLALTWLNTFLRSFAGYTVIKIGFDVFDWWATLWYTGWYWLELCRAFLLYYISVNGWAFAQKTIVSFETLEQQAADKAPGSKQPVKTDELAPLCARLRTHMLAQEPWLNPELTLSDLAADLGLNTAQLSYVINTGFQKNFNDFVNDYRVEAFIRKINDPALTHLSILGIALECGFNSKATFNRAFKKSTGMVPSSFPRQGK